MDELSRAVFTELAMNRTRRAAELAAEAIPIARAHEPRTEIPGSRWQASTREVRDWALSAAFDLGSDARIPEHGHGLQPDTSSRSAMVDKAGRDRSRPLHMGA